jgi:hypothetical protein
MANTDYSVTRNDIITEALEHLGALSEGETPSADQITSCARTLNMLLKHWQALWINIYALRETFLFLFEGVFKYDQLDFNGTAGLDVDRKHVYVSDYQRIAFAESSTTVVTVNEAFVAGTPVATAAVGDVIGIPLETGDMHWAEITAVGTGGSFSKSYTFDNHPLSSATAPDTAKDLIVAITYPGRPIKITNAYLRHFYDEQDVEIEVLSHSDWAMLAGKNNPAQTGVTQLYYNRETTTGDLRTHGTIDSPYYCLGLWVQVPLSDIESDAALLGNFGIPQEYFLALSFNLAKALLPKYGPAPDVANYIRSQAKEYKDDAFAYDTENVSMRFVPDLRHFGD